MTLVPQSLLSKHKFTLENFKSSVCGLVLWLALISVAMSDVSLEYLEVY